MSNVFRFGQHRRRPSWHRRRPSSSRRHSGRRPPLTVVLVLLSLAGSALFYAYAMFVSRPSVNEGDLDLSCSSVSVTDGDTFRCGNTRVRMYGIDAPELEGHCRPGRECVHGDPIASTRNLESLIGGRQVACKSVDVDRYGRIVGRCFAGDTDLSCAQVEAGFAVRRYGTLWC